MKLIYIAGQYSAETHSQIDDNIRKAELAAINLWRNGWAVICPHLNTAHFEKYETTDLNYRTWIKGYVEILIRCDAIFMLLGWQNSNGAKLEHKTAKDMGMTIYYQGHGRVYPNAV